MFLIQPTKVILPGICTLGGSSSVRYILFYFNFLIRTGEEIMLLEEKKRIPGLSSPGRVSLPWGQAAAPRGRAAAGMRAEGAPRIPGPTRPPAPEGAPRGERLTAASPISPSLRPSVPPFLCPSVPLSLRSPLRTRGGSAPPLVAGDRHHLPQVVVIFWLIATYPRHPKLPTPCHSSGFNFFSSSLFFKIRF